MNKTTNISPDKSGTKTCNSRIKFDLNPLNYKCFISKSKKPYPLSHYGTHASPERVSHAQNPESGQSTVSTGFGFTKVSQLRIPYIRRSMSTLTMCCPQHQLFNTQVLFMQYDTNQVYTDSTIIKNSSEVQKSTNQQDLSSSMCSDNSEDNEIVKSCLKMLAEQETDTQQYQSVQHSPLISLKTPSSGNNTQLSSRIPNSQTSMYQQQRDRGNHNDNSFTIYLPRVVEDSRTTVMIRNIPNKYTENLLLDLFNKNHKKKIDFFYLPIDFKNNCNVGYAFMNFIHPKFIEDFYTEFHNKKWKLFNSEKICHICYARIQGTSQLSNHFQTSKRFKEGSQHGYKEA